MRWPHWARAGQRPAPGLRFTGSGPPRPPTEASAAARPSASVGAYRDRPADVAAALGASDVAVLTSGTETFSLATAEAMACGTPVVGPARGAIGEFIADAGAGVAFAPGSAVALGDALCDVLARPAAQRPAPGLPGR